MPGKLRNRAIAATVSSLALLAAACGGAQAAKPATPTTEPALPEHESTITDTMAEIWLVAPMGNHQEGWATLWEQDGSLFVEINVSPPEAVAQPAHIHQGDCSQLGVIDHRLENVIAGKSLTELEGFSIEDLANGNLAINLHLSFADFSTFTACGEIPALETTSN